MTTVQPTQFIGNQFKEKLSHGVFVCDISPQLNQIVSVRLDETLEVVLDRLLENNITSLPLLDPDNAVYVGFIDLFDIFKFLVDEVITKYNQPTVSEVVEIFSKHDLRSVLKKIQKEFSFQTISPDAPIQEAINKLSEDGVYRLAVYSNIGLESVLSQSRLVRWLSNRTDSEIGDLTSKRIMSLPLGSSDIVKVHENNNLIDAFLTIRNKNVSGVVIVDDNDKMIGNVSMSDIKSIGTKGEFIRIMDIPCKEYIMSKIEGHPVPRIVSLNDSCTLNEVLQYLRATFVHRIYITSNDTIKKVITLTDILKLFKTSAPLLKS